MRKLTKEDGIAFIESYLGEEIKDTNIIKHSKLEGYLAYYESIKSVVNVYKWIETFVFNKEMYESKDMKGDIFWYQVVGSVKDIGVWTYKTGELIVVTIEKK